MVAVTAMVKPVGDTGDSSGGNFDFFGDCLIRTFTFPESLRDLEAFGKLIDFREGEEVSEEFDSLVSVLEFDYGGVEFLSFFRCFWHIGMLAC